MKKYRNGKLVDMTPDEIKYIEESRVRAEQKRLVREAEEAERLKREQALNELIDAQLAKRG